MSTLTDICQVCLQTDRKFIILDNELSYYHMELTDYAFGTAQSQVCLECGHHLKKAYNFKQKCLKAAKILQQWKTSKIDAREPISRLQMLLPQSTLTVWREDDSKIFSYCWEESGFTAGVQGEELLEETNLNTDIKLEKEDYETDSQDVCLQDLISFKVEETKNVFQEVFIPNDDSLNNIQKSKTTEDHCEIGINESERNDFVALPDDASINSDDDYGFSKEINQRKRRRKKSLVELADISLSSDDFDDHNQSKKTKLNKKISNLDDVLNTDIREKNIVAKLKTISENLDAIHENWQKISLKELPELALSNDEICKEIKRSVAKKKIVGKDDLKLENGKRKEILAQLADLNEDLDMIHSNCGKIISYKKGLMQPKENLKAELTAKFAACGELKTEKGYVIDKEVIMSCFDRVSECLMRRLWRFVYGKETLDQPAIRLLKHIQIKYQDEYQYETVFDIDYLDTEDKVMEEFHHKRQTYECYKSAKYKCEKCYLGFKYEAQLVHHTSSHEEGAGDFACKVCGVRHKTKKSYTSHSKSHEAVYKCRLCPLVTYYRDSMKNHFHQHQGVQYECNICHTTFKSKSAQHTHVGRYHRDNAAEALSQRTQTEAGDTPSAGDNGATVHCSQCDLTFTTQSACFKHSRSVHALNKYTSKKIKTERPKKKPIFECRVCDAVGTSIGWLNVHFSSEHPSSDMALYYTDKQRHLCHVCGKGFANVYNLRDHLNLHSGVRPYPCAVCGARFHRSYALAEHRRTHAPPARACAHCGKMFRSNSNLYNHVKSHIGDRRYKCNICGKGFLHRNALNEHIRGVHHKLRRVRKRGAGEAEGKRGACSDDST